MQMPAEKKIGREPWHISYMPLAEKAKQLFSAEVLLQAWEKEEIVGKATLQQHLPQIFEQYFV